MSLMLSDAALVAGARPIGDGPVREARPAARPSWLRIVGLTLLAGAGLVLGAFVGVLLSLATGLIVPC